MAKLGTRLLSVFLWTALVIFFISNLIALRYYQSKLSRLLSPSLSNPFSIAQHVTVAKTLWDMGFHKTATRELIIAADLVEAGGSVLGATSNPTTILAEWKQEPSKLTSAYEYWKSVTILYPDYRDGYLIAGTLAYQLGNVGTAKQLIEKAYTLDPNYKPIVDMLKKIEE
jgi:tetratricopeptide (TPR) repeat protein